MNLELDNIGKIRKAAVNLRGLTVVVGDNNAGKSTIGKVLAALFTALPTIEKRILRARKNYVLDDDVVPRAYRFRLMDDSDFRLCLGNDALTEEAFESMMAKAWREGLRVFEEVPDSSKTLSQEDLDAIKKASKAAFVRMQECRKIPDKQLADSEIGRLFSSFFNRNVKRSGESLGMVRLREGAEEAFVSFGENVGCEFKGKFVNRGWFLGSPLLINSISRVGFRISDPEPMHRPLLNRLNDLKRVNSVAKAIAEESLRPVASRLERILGGKMYYSEEDDELMISGASYVKPLPVRSLSMGLKAFAVLYWMLELDVLRKGDVLVLDEPENHLHPSWQIRYAEIVVLLQKCFELKILLTTHSPYFLEAVQLFAKKYGSDGLLDAYQPEFDLDGGAVSFDHRVTDNAVLYRKFTAPLRELDIMRAEWHEDKELK